MVAYILFIEHAEPSPRFLSKGIATSVKTAFSGHSCEQNRKVLKAEISSRPDRQKRDASYWAMLSRCVKSSDTLLMQ